MWRSRMFCGPSTRLLPALALGLATPGTDQVGQTHLFEGLASQAGELVARGLEAFVERPRILAIELGRLGPDRAVHSLNDLQQRDLGGRTRQGVAAVRSLVG